MQRLIHLEQGFPKLADAGYDKTSDETGEVFAEGSYNCIAWAAEDIHHKFWWPDGGYWPLCKRELTVGSFVRTFHRLGYVRCKHSRREFAYNKVVLYAIHRSRGPAAIPTTPPDFEDWEPTHMARQLPDGTWTSKCGQREDITHFTLDALESYGIRIDAYGCPVLFMKRVVLISWIVSWLQFLHWKSEVLGSWIRLWIASHASSDHEG